MSSRTFILRILRWFCKPEYYPDIEGDLLELFERRAARMKMWRANLLLLRDVILLFRPGIIARENPFSTQNATAMLYHNLLLSLRSFARYKSTFLINLVGLASGLTCVVLIMLWVTDELSVDRFHEKEERLYQIMNNFKSTDGIQTLDATPVPLAASLKADMPEVEYAVSVNNFFSWQTRTGILTASDTVHVQAGGWHAGEDFFNVFSYNLVQGDKRSVLTDKNNIVISQALAKKLFPETNDVVGKSLEWKHPFFNGVFVVSGVFESLPRNSTAQFDFLIGMDVLLDNDRWAKEWTGNYASTYVVLRDGASVDNFNKKIEWLLGTKKSALKDKFQLFAQLYKDRYLNGHYENGRPDGGRIVYVRLFSVVAFFILAIACINFMNLSTAKATLRMKEIGIKKTIGAARSSLIARFMTEAVLLVIFAMIIAIPLVIMLLPPFNEIADKDLTLSPDKSMIAGVTGVVLLAGMLSGSYPAFYLSGFRPAVVLKGKTGEGWGLLTIRKGLVVFQFTLSIMFIIGLLVIQEQVDYARSKNMGYDRDNIVIFQWKGELFDMWSGLLEGKSNATFETFLQQVKTIPGVTSATNMSGNILTEIFGQSGITWSGNEDERNYVFQSPVVGYDFIETLGIRLKEGRAFSKEHHDGYSRVILNETAVRMMDLKDPVGKKIDMNGGSEIIGVVEDFHYGSLHQSVEPLILRCLPTGRTVMIRIKAGSEKETIGQLEQLYHGFLPEYAFSFSFMNDDYNAMYKSEERVADLSRYFSLIAIIISCLGVFGLATFSAERRMKEIGIRKVLGAGTSTIVRLLAGEFTWPVLIAICIALPVSYGLSVQWLNGFSERVALKWWMFAGAGLFAMAITWVTVGIHTLKVAMVDPLQSLKDE